jgi:micrococcal nuclease
MRIFLRCLCCIVCLNFSIASICYGKVQEHKIYRVVRVIDGDTFKLANGDHVRMIGIDAPEKEDNPKLQRDIKERHLSKTAELAMGRQSYSFTKHLIEGKKIRLEFDKEKYDEYHRVLAYVYLTNGIFVNAKIIDAGYAYPYVVQPNIKQARLFNRFYMEAKDRHRGLWKDTQKKSIQWFAKG